MGVLDESARDIATTAWFRQQIVSLRSAFRQETEVRSWEILNEP
jgi:hypothetical protein